MSSLTWCFRKIAPPRKRQMSLPNIIKTDLKNIHQVNPSLWGLKLMINIEVTFSIFWILGSTYFGFTPNLYLAPSDVTSNNDRMTDISKMGFIVEALTHQYDILQWYTNSFTFFIRRRESYCQLLGNTCKHTWTRLLSKIINRLRRLWWTIKVN